MIGFDHVSKFVLSDITMHIPQGKTAGLVGASGAGKTTFLKLACGLLLPEKGKIYVMGHPPACGKRGYGRFLSALFADKPLFNGEDTVRENFRLLGAVYRLPDEDFCRDYRELSKRLGFREFEKEPVKNLSLGQKRRAELGAALLCRPGLLLLDEPSTGLDENAKAEFRTLLAERKKAENMTVVVSSHDMSEISGLCDRILLLHRGKLLYYGEEQGLRRNLWPLEEIMVKITGIMPDLEDLPLEKYCFDGEELRITYRADFITSAEILKFILQRCPVTEVGMSRPDLAQIVACLTLPI